MIIDLLFLVAPFLLAIIGFPVFGKNYGEHWEIIQLISLFLMNVYFWLDMAMRFARFAKAEYLFYKSVGMRSAGIIGKYAKSNSRFLYVWAGVCFICVYDGQFVENLIVWLQWIMIIAAVTILIFEILHLKCRAYFGIGGICVAGVVFVLLIKEIIQSGATGMNRLSLKLITEIGIMRVVKGMMLEINLVLFVVAVALLLISIMLIGNFDNKIIDGLKGNGIKLSNIRKHRQNQINPGRSRSVIELKRLVKMQNYVIAVVLEYAFILAGIIFSLKFETDIVWWFYIFAAVGGFLAEAFYTLDIPCKLMYRLLGLEFKDFFRVKFYAVLLAEVPVLVFFGIGTLLGCVSFLELLIVVAMLFINVFFMNAFYSEKYLGLKYKNGAGYVVESFIVGVTAFIPVINLIAGLVLYNMSEKRWHEHVGD